MKVRWASGFSATGIGDYWEGRVFIARMAGGLGGIAGKIVTTGIRFRPVERREARRIENVARIRQRAVREFGFLVLGTPGGRGCAVRP